MKSIKGRFCTASGRPAAYGKLELELMSDEERPGVPFEPIPINEEVAKAYLVPIDEEYRKDWREKESWRTPEDLAAREAEEFAPTYDIPSRYEFELDGDGRIPDGALIVGNDELAGNTCYRAVATLPAPTNFGVGPVKDSWRPVVWRNEELRIEGDSPIVLPPVQPEPEIIPPTPRELELRAEETILRDGTPRLGKKSHLGFAIGPIDCPVALTVPAALPCLVSGTFGVYGFRLSSPALVNHVSVYVEETTNRDTLLIAIYDTNGSKVIETEIDLSKAGAATATLPSEVHLPEGDYFLAWALRTGTAAKLRGFVPQLDLMNAAGAPVVGLGQATDRNALPPTLGRFLGPDEQYSDRRLKPIFAYFKA